MARHLSHPTFHVTAVVGDKIPFIPGLKTSATFLTSLSANLRIPDDELYPTPISTPLFRSSDATPLPPLSHLSAMTLSHDASSLADASLHNTHDAPLPFPSPLEGLPELSTYPAKSETDRIAALKLVADSVAQQRQLAARAIIYHPAALAGVTGILLLMAQFMLRGMSTLPLFLTTIMSLSTAWLFGVRWMTSGYLKLAEAIGWDWLGDDMLLVTKWGEKVIGVVVMGWAIPECTVGGRKFKKRNEKKKWGVVRAWTVDLKYRKKGVGKALLEEAVQEVVKKGGEGIEFADEHANHHRLINPIFNSPMDENEKKAMDMLNDIARTQGNFGRRRS